jgi:hypothetical protein
MFDKLKNFLAGIGFAWKYSDVFRNVITAWSKFSMFLLPAYL